ncbi:MAG: hypothetical protein AAB433_17285 [Nitrospirota bacterium]
MLLIENLLIIATDFRRAFEDNDLSKAPGFLPHFPEGCCSWATWMIGHFLKFEMYQSVEEINAERASQNGTIPHAWLSADGIIIDITSDEFEDSEARVIVSRNSDWHKTWSIVQTVEIQRIDIYDRIGIGPRASDIYELLVTSIRRKHVHT